MRWRTLLLGLLLLPACGAARPAHPTYAPPALRRADAAFDRRDYGEAVRIYGSFLRHHPPAEYVAQAAYKLALTQFRLRHFEAALATLDRLRERFPDGRWVQVWTLYGDIQQALGNRVTALIWWERAWHLATPEEEGQVSARILDIVRQLPDAERNRALALVSTEFIRRALETERDVGVASAAVAPTPTVAPASGGRIGVLLPLSGPHAELGEHSLEGASLAVPDDAKLVVRDTADSANRGRAAFQELATDANVVGVVGPLGSPVAEMVAPQAERTGLPLLLLSQHEGLTGRSVMQPVMTPTLQAETLSAYAVGRLALHHLAILYPEDAYGERMRVAFHVSAERNGAQILGEVSYSPGQQDFDDEIGRLRDFDQGARLDAVFIPDAAEVVALIAPRLHEQLPRVRLLGTADWDEPFVLQSVSAAVQGAVFVDGFFADSARPATRAFVDEFARRYGRRPGILEAQAYDATRLLEEVMQRGARTRQDARRQLADYGMFEGATGDLDLRGGAVHRRLFLLTVRDGKVEELAP